jgi:glutamate dehydrogenase/leucine dehydrogenase
VKHYYDIFRNSTLNGKKVIVQGWGNVASAAACYLANYGVKVIGIIDKDFGVIREQGLSFEEVKRLFVQKKGNVINSDELLPFEEVNERIWDLGADIFIPGAASKLVTRKQVESMINGGLEVMSCGANVPFIDDGVFFGPTAKYTDSQVSLVPDFIANCGMARVFAYLMHPGVSVTDEAIFGDVSNTIKEALQQVYDYNPSLVNISTSALKLSLSKLMNINQLS